MQPAVYQRRRRVDVTDLDRVGLLGLGGGAALLALKWLAGLAEQDREYKEALRNEVIAMRNEVKVLQAAAHDNTLRLADLDKKWAICEHERMALEADLQQIKDMIEYGDRNDAATRNHADAPGDSGLAGAGAGPDPAAG